MRISKKRFKAVLCAILSMCIFAYRLILYLLRSRLHKRHQLSKLRQPQLTRTNIDALENRRQELQAQSDKYQQILEKTKENIADQEEYVNALVSKVQVLDDKIELSHQSINELNGKIQDKQTAIDNANKSLKIR